MQNNKLKMALDLKIQGIADVDNFIYLNGYGLAEAKELAKYIRDKYNKYTEIIDLKKITENFDSSASHETNATKFIYEFMKIRDKVMQGKSFYLILDINSFYNKNEIVTLLSKSNINFLLWYTSFVPTFTPLFNINRSDDTLNFGVVNEVCPNPDLLPIAFDDGLEKLFGLIKSIEEKEISNASNPNASKENS